MTTHPYMGSMTFPILDPETVSLADIKAEALAGWRAALAYEGYLPVGNVAYDITHGATPTITVSSAVAAIEAVAA